MKRYSFFQKCYLSVASPNFYVEIAKERISKSIGFLILVVLIIGAISGFAQGLIFKDGMYEFADIVEGPDFPYFELTDGTLHVDIDEPFIYELDNAYILIVDMYNEYTMSDLRGYDVGYLFQKTEFVLRTKDSNPTALPYSTMDFLELNPTTAASLIRTIGNIAPIISMILLIIVLIFATVFRVIIMYLVSFFITRKNGIPELTGKPLINIVIYSMALPTLLYELLILLPLLLNFSYGFTSGLGRNILYLSYIIPSAILISKGVLAYRLASEQQDDEH